MPSCSEEIKAGGFAAVKPQGSEVISHHRVKLALKHRSKTDLLNLRFISHFTVIQVISLTANWQQHKDYSLAAAGEHPNLRGNTWESSRTNIHSIHPSIPNSASRRHLLTLLPRLQLFPPAELGEGLLLGIAVVTAQKEAWCSHSPVK